MAHIALIGATGTIGSRILDEALRRGHTVTAIVRDPAKLDRSDVTAKTGDVLDEAALPDLLAGHDVVVSAVGGGDGPGHSATIAPAAKALVGALRKVDGAPRLIVVNGAGSLRTADGTRVWDQPGLPDWLLQIMHSHGDALDYLRGVADVNWTALSPAATIEPGERTGRYRTGVDELVTDAEGVSWISAEDYAVALLDEIERPAHEGRRFTVAR
ncbi:NAD(P)-dependent oxidoreductase [Actinosynnema sp. CS-041913]|uniref:NAD(P)-dependent oxidoreductase n=1 Tax=Actinosynnema sp. CS-041913 TaxID=3239917 RepID=UPI003D8ED846